ncbi:MAG: hypothetical protein GX627_00700 [Parcubacteria group bacterium]|nr:hypothetical protein [Parcubacteria group bacterium]
MKHQKTKQFLPFIFLALLILIPAMANAGIIPCKDNCNFEHLIELVRNVIDLIIKISIPVATAVFAWAGFKYMTSGVVDQKAEAKEMIRKVFIGFVFILSAWLIVSTIINALLNEDFRNIIDIGTINLINIYV